MVISIGFGRCGCRILNSPDILTGSKIFVDIDSLSLPTEKWDSKMIHTHITDTRVCETWFDVTVNSSVSEKLIQSSLSSIRRLSEKSDRTDDIHIFTSPSGASGGGLTSMFVETMKDESYKLKFASIVLPHELMVRPSQCVNTVMTLGSILDSVDTIICFENTKMLKSDFLNVNRKISGFAESLHHHIDHCNFPKGFQLGNFFVRNSINEDTVLTQFESFLGPRNRPNSQQRFLGDNGVAILCGPSGEFDNNLFCSIDSIFGKTKIKKLNCDKPVFGISNLAVMYRDKCTISTLFNFYSERAKREQSRFVPKNHFEWFSEYLEKLKFFS